MYKSSCLASCTVIKILPQVPCETSHGKRERYTNYFYFFFVGVCRNNWVQLVVLVIFLHPGVIAVHDKVVHMSFCPITYMYM